MRHVPISAFKENASALFAAAEAGEEIVVTRHGKPVVRMQAVDEARDRRARFEQAWQRMAENRERMRAEGRTVTIEEVIEWKNEGRKYVD